MSASVRSSKAEVKKTKTIPSENTHEERVTTISLNLRGNKSRGARKTQAQFSYLADLRIHKPEALGLSCGQSMPGGIDAALALLNLAKAKQLDVIAITDFYDVSFAEEVRTKNANDIKVIPGFTIRCKLNSLTDSQFCCLFDPSINKIDLQACLTELCPENTTLKEEYIVQQPLEAVAAFVERYGGVIFPSKVDRTPAQQACIRELIEKYRFRTFDLAFVDSKAFFKKNWPNIDFNFFRFSAARTLAQAGNRAARLSLEAEGWTGIKQALSRP